MALLLFAVLAARPSGGLALVFETFQGKVVAVKDGDSIVVLRDGRRIEVRLNGVDAPESGQAFGSRAEKFALASCYNSVVTVREVGLDKYGRRVAEVTLPDGKSFNQEIVRAGYAWWFRRYSTDDVLRRLEEEARAAKRGLWIDKNPLPPWEYRSTRSAAEAGGEKSPAINGEAAGRDPVVYVTASGGKYHKKNCKSLHGKGVAIPYRQAAGTYGPCKICGGN